ncbi:related to dnaJ-like proteins [Ramularia collo-cygni]|uniref:Related to dnaJ-like proteins n=1 Tax=Ramularia collo-cygni TaxID=112498 RepID=A0A2D3V4V6_9PEZI|nr:related to dnaJ-like proteins [Ramularia collo-cygni]CZT18566.1 related to dnaJ-like proteins [Ramularia collo-cygni]
MGASQSANTGGGAADVETKTSYYELLGIEKQATEDEIKKAYRRKALELHPDRNYGNEESATKTFAEIQSVYEILSDPQERSWYDSHEQSILRGDDGRQDDSGAFAAPSGVTTADDLTRLVRKFNRNVEFTDSPSGFFGFIRETFEQLAKEEMAAAWENGDAVEYPTFGHKDDDYGDVVKSFYAAWSSFSTSKSFSWEDRYRTSEAPDRFVRRRMEQENLRLRKDAKQEFNDAVRSLVAFVRKRDPRYVPNTQTEEERQKTLREATAAQAARARAANAAKMNDEVPEWTKIRDPEELEESEEEEVDEEVIECVACSKTFKSEKSWQAHEKSKKHQKAVRSLQHRMRKENAHLDLPGSDEENGVVDEEDFELIDDVDGEEQDPDPTANGHSHRQDEETQDHDDINEHTNGSAAPEEVEAENTPVPQNKPTNSPEDAESEDSDYAPIESIQARMQSVALENSTELSESEPTTKVEPKMGKAAQKRAKRAAAAAAAAEPGEQSAADASATCEVCKESFASRTKLFQHVKDKNHAALKSAVGGKGKKGKGKR